MAFAVISEVQNDAIVDEEDVQRYLELITLASVPEKEETNGKRRRKKKVKRMEAKQG